MLCCAASFIVAAYDKYAALLADLHAWGERNLRDITVMAT